MSTAEAPELSLIGWPFTRPVYDSDMRCYKATFIYQTDKKRRFRKKIRKAKRRLKQQRECFAEVKINQVDSMEGVILIVVELLVVSKKFDYNAGLIGKVIEEAFAR